MISQCLKPEFRWVERVEWLQALIKPVKSIHANLLSFRKRENYYLSFNFQRGSMEKLLNEEYPNATNGIYIEDYAFVNTTYTFNHNENQQPPHTYNHSEGNPLYTINHSEAGAGPYEYIIWVPSTVSYVEAQMRALVDRYNQAPKRYIIQTY